MSPDGRYAYFTRDRSFADKRVEAALSTGMARGVDGHADALGDSWGVPTSAVFEALGRTPR